LYNLTFMFLDSRREEKSFRNEGSIAKNSISKAA
jgi:hypothetical protein